MRCEKFGCKRNCSWLGFDLAKFGGLTFFAFLAKLVNKWNYGFCAILVGNYHKCIQNELWKSLVAKGIDLGWILALPSSFALVAKLVNKWSYGFCAILVGNSHKCIKNEVWKVWLPKELILVGFGLSQVRWIGFFFCIGSKISELVRLWFLCNIGGELSHIHQKWGVKILVARAIELGWVLA